MAYLESIEEKWYRKTIAAFREKWAQMVASADSFTAFCEGISAATGIPANVIASSLPAKNYKEFQANASRYLERAVSKIEAAYRAKKWSVKYRKAFGG